MKYIVRQLSEDIFAEELEQARQQFIEALNYALESATLFFDSQSGNPLDFYIAYDFQQKHGEPVVYGFNLRDELIRIFKLDENHSHSSKLALAISQQLIALAEELQTRYDSEPTKIIEETQEKKDTDYAKSVNRSYREVLREAMEKDQAEQLNKAKQSQSNGDGYQRQTVLLRSRMPPPLD